MSDFATGLLITGVVSIVMAFIGTWCGAWVIIKRQESASVYPRKLILEVLNTLDEYPNYHAAESHFNNRSTIEKKAVIVALKNLGVPLRINVIDDCYDVSHVIFDDKQIDKAAITKMKDFVTKGLCDDLFFKEIGADFYNASPKIIFARNLAVSFLDALGLQSNAATISDVLRAAKINLNQYQVIEVFWNTVIFTNDNKICTDKINEAKINVKNGIFDHLFYWDIRAFANMNSNRSLADNLNRLVVGSPVQNNDAALSESASNVADPVRS